MKHIALVLTIALAGCSLTPREKLHWQTMSKFQAIEEVGDVPEADPQGWIRGDCDNFAASFNHRTGGQCEVWHVYTPEVMQSRMAGPVKTGGHHAVCLYPDGYYADNTTLFGSTDKTRYRWLQPIPGPFPVVDKE